MLAVPAGRSSTRITTTLTREHEPMMFDHRSEEEFCDNPVIVCANVCFRDIPIIFISYVFITRMRALFFQEHVGLRIGKDDKTQTPHIVKL